MNKLSFLFIPDHDRIHAPQPGQAIRSPLNITGQDYFRIAVGTERITGQLGFISA